MTEETPATIELPADPELLDKLVLLASRSPSPHNTQPWSPRVVDGGLEVSIVPSRTLPAGDPTFRDVIMSLGAWIESVAIGAAEAGYDIEVEPLPALSHLDALPVTGPADPENAVFRVSLLPSSAGADSSAGQRAVRMFTSADVRDRRVYRGKLVGRKDVFADLGALDLPPWLTLRTLDDRAMKQLSTLGIAFTASRTTIANELLHWLRLDPRHPRYTLDGMTDEMLVMPRAIARVAAPFTRTARLRDPVVAAAGPLARFFEGLGRDAPLPTGIPDEPGAPTHHVLVANSRAAGIDDVLSVTEAMDSRIGVTEPHALEAGRVLQRLWLHAYRQGIAISPHSELIDSPAAHGALRKHLGLARSDVALSVFSAGVAQTMSIPRSPRLSDAQLSAAQRVTRTPAR
jgi:nitroreductase